MDNSVLFYLWLQGALIAAFQYLKGTFRNDVITCSDRKRVNGWVQSDSG